MADTETSRTGEVSSLVRTLGIADQRLEELTEGQIDSVVDREGRQYLLRHAQDRLRSADIAQRAAILDALPAHIALLDPNGFIVAVNAAWRRFAEANNYGSTNCGLGLDYAAICDRARGADARAVAVGIRAVLAGHAGSFETEYACGSPTEERWFLLAVTPVAREQPHGAVVMHLDITERRRAEQDLRRFTAGLDATADAVFLVDRPTMRFIHVNEAACRMHGMTREQLLAVGPAAFIETSYAQLEQEYDALIADRGVPHSRELRRDGPAQTERWIDVRRHAYRFGSRWTICMLIRDITERKQAERRIAQLNRLYAVLSGINSLIVHARDRDELFTGACRIAVELGAFSMAWIGVVNPPSLDGEVVASCGGEASYLRKITFTMRDDVPDSSKPASRALRHSQPAICNDIASDPSIASTRDDLLRHGHRSVGCFPLKVAGQTQAVFALFAAGPDMFDEAEMRLLTEMSGDISFALDHIARQNQLTYLAYYDELTGLANRGLFCDRAEQQIPCAVNDQSGFVVALIDLEQFKNVNQTLGRPTGDLLLQRVAEWLKRYVGDASLVARMGADQFAVMLRESPGNELTVQALDKALEAFLGHAFELNGVGYRTAARVGLALLSDDARDIETLLARAELALKEAKIQGRRYMFYAPIMTALVVGKLKLETQLRMALERQEFLLHYQPKFNLATGELIGAEALLRWCNPQSGLIAPGQFIPILEESKLIIDVGRWVLRQAMEDQLRWRAAGFADVRVAVNVSPVQLRHRDFVADVTRVVGERGQNAAGLELEITEGVIMEDAARSIAGLSAIRALGVKVAVDDFGTGFSSLSYLSRLPLDSLKIDRSFVAEMMATPAGLALVSGIINLAHSLGLSVVAEGVETPAQSQLLQSLNCNEVQGFLFGRPVTRKDFETQYLTPAPASRYAGSLALSRTDH